jgi:hypothetical protein
MKMVTRETAIVYLNRMRRNAIRYNRSQQGSKDYTMEAQNAEALAFAIHALGGEVDIVTDRQER